MDKMCIRIELNFNIFIFQYDKMDEYVDNYLWKTT